MNFRFTLTSYLVASRHSRRREGPFASLCQKSACVSARLLSSRRCNRADRMRGASSCAIANGAAIHRWLALSAQRVRALLPLQKALFLSMHFGVRNTVSRPCHACQSDGRWLGAADRPLYRCCHSAFYAPHHWNQTRRAIGDRLAKRTTLSQFCMP